MQGSFSEESLRAFNQLVSGLHEFRYEESLTDSYDFTRCVRPNGTAYGTHGKCKKGSEQIKDTREKRARNTDNSELVISKALRKVQLAELTEQELHARLDHLLNHPHFISKGKQLSMAVRELEKRGSSANQLVLKRNITRQNLKKLSDKDLRDRLSYLGHSPSLKGVTMEYGNVLKELDRRNLEPEKSVSQDREGQGF